MNDVFAKAIEQTKPFLAPVVKSNKLAVANVEKLVALQLSSLQSYVDLGVNQLKEAAEVSSPQSLQAFYNQQLKAAETLRQKLVEDGKALVELGVGAKAEFEALAKENLAELNSKAAEVVKPVKPVKPVKQAA